MPLERTLAAAWDEDGEMKALRSEDANTLYYATGNIQG